MIDYPVQEALSGDGRLIFYGKFNFIRQIPPEVIRRNLLETLLRFEESTDNTIAVIEIAGYRFYFFISYLDWDTTFFNRRTYKIEYVSYPKEASPFLAKAWNLICSDMLSGGYCFMEVPSEDIGLIRSMGQAQFRLVETRLTYFRGDLEQFDHERSKVRQATGNDASNLMRVAREMRNIYDRFHADDIFDEKIADEFLARYIQESIKGFADVVLVPDEAGVASDSFLTAKYLKQDWENFQCKVSKMVLSAVSSATNKGWYKKLITEMTYLLRDAGAEYIFMNTQSTNRAVFHTWESLGYRLGCTTHIFSKYND